MAGAGQKTERAFGRVSVTSSGSVQFFEPASDVGGQGGLQRHQTPHGPGTALKSVDGPGGGQDANNSVKMTIDEAQEEDEDVVENIAGQQKKVGPAPLVLPFGHNA